MLFLLAMSALSGCSGDTALTSKPVGPAPGAVAGEGAAPGSAQEGEGEARESNGAAPGEGALEGALGEGRGDGEGNEGAAPDEGGPEGSSGSESGEGAAADGVDAGGDGQAADDVGACVRREREDVDVCADPCSSGCGEDEVCLTFPEAKLCLSAGDRGDGSTCTSPSDCTGGLCIWSGGGPAHCSRECPSMGGGGDAVCGEGRSCLPSTTPAGSYHCYATGDLLTGDPCLRKEGECQGGYCLGAGQAAYCPAWCDPADPISCPGGWTCRPYGDAHICCDPNRTQGGC